LIVSLCFSIISGDSGGPIIVPVPFSTRPTRKQGGPPAVFLPKYFQLGVVSFGPVQCGVGGLPGVYTRVYSYKQWILENLEP
jgi:secreted trypsin-like serine protease